MAKRERKVTAAKVVAVTDKLVKFWIGFRKFIKPASQVEEFCRNYKPGAE